MEGDKVMQHTSEMMPKLASACRSTSTGHLLNKMAF